jgi:hypothetical protein
MAKVELRIDPQRRWPPLGKAAQSRQAGAVMLNSAARCDRPDMRD